MSGPAKRASCLCGDVTYKITGKIHHVRFCHCTNCRKFSGTSHAAWGLTATADLCIDQPNPNITKYNAGSGSRVFCSRCGSPLWFEPDGLPQSRGIPLGVVDDHDALPSPEMHVWTKSKVAWESILDGLPQHKTHP